jgi:predicted transposase/invertase (TIGR01784 family)
MSQVILPVKRDIIFKIFFADERNIEFLTDFLKSALTIPAEEYDEVLIVDPHLIREHPSDKLGIIDVKLKTVSGKTIHIEIQIAPLPHMRERIAYYDAKMITEQIGKSEKYKDIRQVISIVITEQEFIEDSPNYHHRFTMYDSVNKVELTDIVEVHTLELSKLPAEATGNRLCYWMEFIKAEGEIELEAVAQRDPLIKKAVARLMELSADEKPRLLYEAREKERMDMESREDWARTEKAIEIAKSLLNVGDSVDKIVMVTGLTRAEVENLRSSG